MGKTDTTEIVVDLDAPERPTPADDMPDGVEAIETDSDEIRKLPKGAVANADGSVTLPLIYPRAVTVKSQGGVREERFDTFVLHRLTGGDYNAVQAASKGTAQVVLLARSLRKHTAIVKALYDKLDMRDIARAGEVLDSFF
jgi:hypothetical protein